MGKGSKRRPSAVTREEEELRWSLFQGEITMIQFDASYEKLKRKGLIRRNGRIVK